MSNPWTPASVIIHEIPYTITPDQGNNFIVKEVLGRSMTIGFTSYILIPHHTGATSRNFEAPVQEEYSI